jgi:hypothetical protein
MVVLIVLAMVLRIPGLFTEFWGDEIWSWWIAGHIHSVADILLSDEARIDNNHPLATLFLYLMGQDQPVWVYRLPALLAGVATVVLATRLMIRIGRLEALIALLLFSCNFLLIFYSSEARGYAFVVFFSLLTFELLQTALARRDRSALATELGLDLALGICCTLGFLSHLMFINAYTAALAWSFVRLRQIEPSSGKRLLRLARLHLLPIGSVVVLFNVFVTHLVDGGAPPSSPGTVLLQTMSLAVGGPSNLSTTAVVTDLAALAAVLLFAAALRWAMRDRTGIWVFYLFAIVISPALMCTRALYFNAKAQPLMPRYFLISIAMLLLLASPLLARLWRAGGRYRRVLLLLMTLYLAGNLWNLGEFLSLGRGQYAVALAQMAAQTPAGQELRLCSENPIRTQLLLNFYGQRVCGSRGVSVTSEPTPWLVRNWADARATRNFKFCGRDYELWGVFPSCELSGWTWQIYHRKVR